MLGSGRGRVEREKPDQAQLEGRRWGELRLGTGMAGTQEHSCRTVTAHLAGSGWCIAVCAGTQRSRPLGHMREWGQHKCPLLTGSKANLTSIQAAGLKPLPCSVQWVATVTPNAQHHEFLGRDWVDFTQVLPSFPLED